MKDTISSKDPLASFKFAGLRACAAAQAPMRTSKLVSVAAWIHQKRKACKTFFKQLLKAGKADSKTPFLKVLVRIKGGIGDVAMTRVFVKKLREVLPQAHISFSYDNEDVVQAIFPDGLIDQFQPINYQPSQYDLVVSGCHLLSYEHIDRARIRQLAPHFLPILEQGLSVQNCFKEFAVYSPHLDGLLAEIAIEHGGSRITNLGWFSGLEVHQNDHALIALSADKTDEVLTRLHLSAKSYITIHDGINTNTDTSSGYPTRCWPVAHWEKLCAQIKQRFPYVPIVQLGGNKSKIFPFVDISLVNKTTITDLPYVLDNSLLHIDGESGMVHLAHLTSVRSIVLFGPSKAAYLGYERNVNLTSPACSGCMNIYPDWMTNCLLHKPHAQQCLAQITVEQVFEKAEEILGMQRGR